MLPTYLPACSVEVNIYVLMYLKGSCISISKQGMSSTLQRWYFNGVARTSRRPQRGRNTHAIHFSQSNNNVSNTNISSFSSALLSLILMTMCKIWVTMAFGKVCPLQDGIIKTWALCTQVSIVVNVFQHSLIGVQHGGTMVASVHWLLLCDI
jgi:hypothetical protein